MTRKVGAAICGMAALCAKVCVAMCIALCAALVFASAKTPQEPSRPAATDMRAPGVPIHLHPKNPHYFLFRGKPVALIGSGEHYGAVLNAGVDFNRYLATIAADGLNYTRLFGGSYVEVPGQSFGILRNDLAPEPGKFIAPWARSDVAGYAGGGNKFDLARWDAEYFSRFKKFLAEAARRNGNSARSTRRTT